MITPTLGCGQFSEDQFSEASGFQIGRSNRLINPRSLYLRSILGGLVGVMLESSVGSMPAQCQVILYSLTTSPVPETNSVPTNNSVPETVASPPQPVKSEPPQVLPQVPPQVPIVSPPTNPKVAPVIIDPRVEQQVPARSPNRDLLRVVPSPPGTSSDNELGVLRRRQGTPIPPKGADPSGSNSQDANSQDANDEIGVILIRPKPPALPPIKPVRQPVPKSLYLTGRIDYFQNSNVLASPMPQSEGAVRSALSLYYAPALGPKTFLLATAEASLLRYGTLSRLNSDELRIKVGLYHQWTPAISTELGWSYYQLSAAPAGIQQVFQGKRFFNEHSLRFDLVRQDALNPNMSLITLYQLRWNLAGDVDRYDRLVNNAIASLSYKLSPRTQAALDYQYSWTHFTEQSRDDHAHFLGTRLSHSVSDRLQLSAFGGRNFGSSSESRVNLAGWIFGVGLGFNVPIL